MIHQYRNIKGDVILVHTTNDGKPIIHTGGMIHAVRRVNKDLEVGLNLTVKELSTYKKESR